MINSTNNNSTSLYPRIIREFEDDQNESPMFYFEMGEQS